MGKPIFEGQINLFFQFYYVDNKLETSFSVQQKGMIFDILSETKRKENWCFFGDKINEENP